MKDKYDSIQEIVDDHWWWFGDLIGAVRRDEAKEYFTQLLRQATALTLAPAPVSDARVAEIRQRWNAGVLAGTAGAADVNGLLDLLAASAEREAGLRAAWCRYTTALHARDKQSTEDVDFTDVDAGRELQRELDEAWWAFYLAAALGRPA